MAGLGEHPSSARSQPTVAESRGFAGLALLRRVSVDLAWQAWQGGGSLAMPLAIGQKLARSFFKRRFCWALPGAAPDLDRGVTGSDAVPLLPGGRRRSGGLEDLLQAGQGSRVFACRAERGSAPSLSATPLCSGAEDLGDLARPGGFGGAGAPRRDAMQQPSHARTFSYAGVLGGHTGLPFPELSARALQLALSLQFTGRGLLSSASSLLLWSRRSRGCSAIPWPWHLGRIIDIHVL